MSFDFTLTKFRLLCTSVAQHYPTLTLAKYFEGGALPERFAIMRHDIDRKPGNTLSTARMEAEVLGKAKGNQERAIKMFEKRHRAILLKL